MTLLFLGLFVFSLALSFVATRKVRDIAIRRGYVSNPQGGRHLHQTACPRLGGVAIFLAFSLSLILWLGLALIFPRLAAGAESTILLRIYIPACLIFALGIYDDLHGAGPYLKFAVQAIAAIMLFAAGMRVLDVPLLFPHTLPWFVGLPLTVLWVMAVTNAFNLIDGLDGLQDFFDEPVRICPLRDMHRSLKKVLAAGSDLRVVMEQERWGQVWLAQSPRRFRVTGRGKIQQAQRFEERKIAHVDIECGNETRCRKQLVCGSSFVSLKIRPQMRRVEAGLEDAR